MARTHQGDVSAFHCKVFVTPGCHFWTGGTVGGQQSNNGGYGTAYFDGRMQLSHRVAFTISKGLIPEDLVVSHSCDNRLCQNPDHLFACTKKENSEQMVERGRAATNRAPLRPVSLQEITLMVKMHEEGKTWYRIGLDLHRAQQLVKSKVEKFLSTTAPKKPSAPCHSTAVQTQVAA